MKVACLAAVGAFAGSCEAFVSPTAFSGSALLSRPASTQQATSTLCMMARTPIITGNWKMNPGDMQSAVKLAQDVSEVLQRCLRCKRALLQSEAARCVQETLKCIAKLI
eukprot:18284-Heterococcus_DN1.PRE.1